MNKIYSLVSRRVRIRSKLDPQRAGKVGGPSPWGVTHACVRTVRAGTFVLTMCAAALAGVLPMQAHAGNGIFINDGTDSNCASVSDPYQASTNIGPHPFCESNDKAMQIGRALFYNPANQSGSTSLTLGNELYVNGGKFGLSDQLSQTYSMRIGSAATLATSNPGVDSIAVGSAQTSVVNGGSTVATTARGNQAVAIGTDAHGEAMNSIAIGHSANVITDSTSNGASGNFAAIAIGLSSASGGITASGGNGVAVGALSNAISFNGQSPVAVGYNANASGAGAQVAIGDQSRATGSNAVAVGPASSATGISSVAFGNAARATNANDVALGGSAVTSAANTGVSATQVTFKGVTTTFAGLAKAASGVVSVGVAGSERQISNLAAGDLSAGSTDAVNGSQLFITNAALRAVGTQATDLGTAVASDLGGGSTYTDVGGLLAPSYAISNINVAGTNAGVSNQANVGAALGALNTDVVNTAAIAIKGFNLTTAAAGTGVVSGTSVAKVAPGETATITAGNNVLATQAGTTVALGVNPVLTGITSLALTSGPTLSSAGINMGNGVISNVAPGAAGTDAVNRNQLNAVSTTANAGFNLTANGGATSVNIAPGAAVDIASGSSGNLIVAQNTTNGNLTIDTKPDLTATTVSAGSGALMTVVNGTGVMVNGGANGLVSLGNTGLNNGGNTITGVAAGAVSSSSTDAINGSQLAAISQTVNGGFNLTTAQSGTGVANGTSVTAVAPGATVTIEAGNNTIVTQNGSEVTIGVNPVLTGITSLTAGNTLLDGSGVTVGSGAGAVSVTAGGLNNGGNAIVGVAAGTLNGSSTEAVNGSQLYAVANQASQVDTAVGKVAARVNVNEADIGKLQAGADGMLQVSADANDSKPVASGTQSTAAGDGALASGNDSTAVGNGAQSIADNSVAIGAGSVADRADSVSVGTLTGTRQITNVAAGIAATDAANVSQLQVTEAGGVRYDASADGSVNYDSVTLNPNGGGATIHNVNPGTVATDAANVGQLNAGFQSVQNWAKSYTDRSVNTMGRQAFGGVASAIAMASLPQAYQPNQSSAGVALGNFHGQSGIAIGVSTISESGRYIFKLNASDNTRGDAGVGVGAGMVW